MKHSPLTRIGLVLIIAPLLVLGLHYFYELMLVDRCLDAGGSFDYLATSCSFEESSSYIPYSQRYRWSFNIALGITLLGVVIAATGGSARRARHLPN